MTRLYEVQWRIPGGDWTRPRGGMVRFAADTQVRFLRACGFEAYAVLA